MMGRSLRSPGEWGLRSATSASFWAEQEPRAHHLVDDALQIVGTVVPCQRDDCVGLRRYLEAAYPVSLDEVEYRSDDGCQW
jgi:hypothetical protein